MSTDKEFDDMFPEPAEPFGASMPAWKTMKEDDGENLVVMVDGDIVAYRASAPCNGVYYTHPKIEGEFRYHKEIKKIVMDIKENVKDIKWNSKPEPENYAIHNVNQIMKRIFDHFEEPFTCRVFLSGDNNFRMDLFPDYKGHRSEDSRPVHLNACKQHLLNRYNGEVTDHLEADDLLGIHQMEYLSSKRQSVICSIDKDLMCIPGKHYNFVTDTDVEQSEDDALRSFYKQLLMGDKTDNIPGIKGLGPKTAEKLIDPCETEIEMYLVAIDQWSKFMFPDEYEKTAIGPDETTEVRKQVQTVGQLLWILREEGTLWTPPDEE
jgi:hypothetical protein